MLDETLYLNRDCPATLIPAGYEATLEKGCPVVINQALGGSVTVTTPTGMFRIDRSNLDALGEDAQAALEEKLAEQTDDSAILQEPFNDEQVWHVLRSCFDPEIPLNIVDLGLIYSLESQKNESGKFQVDVKMTLTAQGCGMGPTIAADAKDKMGRHHKTLRQLFTEDVHHDI